MSEDECPSASCKKFTRIFTSFVAYPNEVVSACNTKWKIGLQWNKYFQFMVKPEVLHSDVLVILRVDAVPFRIYDPKKDYFKSCSSWQKKAHTFKSDENFVFNLGTRNEEKPMSLLLFIVVEFWTTQTTAELQERKTLKVLDSKVEAENVDETQQTGEAGSNEVSDDLHANFKQLLENEHFSDVTIHCGSQIFKAHKNILFARSPVFATMFQNNMKETLTGEVNIENVEPEVFRIVLTYIYSGEWKQDQNFSADTICGVLALADKYMLSGLKKVCVEKLRHSITEENALDILLVADLYDPRLKTDALKFVCSRYSQMKNSYKWKSVKEQNPFLIIEIMDYKIEFQN